MAKEWTDEEVRAEIAAAVAIVREDRFEQFVRSKIGPTGSAGGPPGNGDPKSPPRGDAKESVTEKKRRSLWWGEDLDEQAS